MIKAVWKDNVLAKSDKTIVVDRRHYFPVEHVNIEFLEKSDFHTVCPWKGEASYYNVVINGNQNENAAWYYPLPNEKAAYFKDYIAFSYIHGIDIVEE